MATDSNVTIGLLAGMGVRSTSPFVDLLIEECQRQYGAKYESDYPRMIIFSWPTPFFPDRQIDHDAMRDSILEGLRWLDRTGVDFIAIPCNTAHIYFDDLAAAAQVPLLNMVDEAVASIPADVGTIALLATRATRDSGVYQDALAPRDFTVVASDDVQDEIDGLLKELRAVSDLTEQRSRWRALLSGLADAGVGAGLVACTDLNVLQDGAPPLQLMDGTRVLASRVIEKWRSMSPAGIASTDSTRG